MKNNGETTFTSGKKDKNQMKGKEGDLMSLILQILTAGILELAHE